MPRNILISVCLVSNRPAVFRALLDNLEETAADPSRIEVLVGIDDHDEPMHALVREEAPKRKLALKYHSSPYTGFLNLWKAFDVMHTTLCDPSAYFLHHCNDEIRYVTPHWDKVLEKYVGLFPDDLFRLRVSKFKLWNYFSLDEAGPHPDNIPIITRKWVDITGWCACHSADSFQQMVTFFLNKGAPEWSNRYHRDIPVMDIELGGLEAGAGLMTPEDEAAYKDRAQRAFAVLFSPAMKLEAQRRANLLRARMMACERSVPEAELEVVTSHSIMYARRSTTGEVLASYPLYDYVDPSAQPLHNCFAYQAARSVRVSRRVLSRMEMAFPPLAAVNRSGRHVFLKLHWLLFTSRAAHYGRRARRLAFVACNPSLFRQKLAERKEQV